MKGYSLPFIRSIFRKYYIENFPSEISISEIEKREFGFASFDGQMVRHKSFESLESIKSFLQNFIPSDAYYSCAYYENPTAEMEKKGWLGADLIFDIDADHLPTPCNKIHDEWSCSNCGFTGKGITPGNCPICNGEKFEVSTWLCQACLDTAKKETIKLLEVLKEDFGFSEKEIHVYFSGHRGYHVHIESSLIQSLDATSRKEIVDYLSGIGFDGKTANATSWSTRIHKGVYDYIINATEEDFLRLGLRKSIVRRLMSTKANLLKNIMEGHEAFKSVKGLGSATWTKIFYYCAQEKFVKIDTVVTTDVHRLVRLPNTLHGKTGFKKVRVPISKIDDFDPFKEAIAFKDGTVKVLVRDAPRFRVGDESLGPYKNVKVELPTAAAILLICKRRAEVLT